MSTTDWRPKAGEIPRSPGVYRFRDGEGRVIYVGKAKSLRSRLSSYFQDVHALHERTRRMVTTARSVEWTVVATEVEALQLEYTWIKEFDPRFNVDYKDDKSYPWLAVTVGDEVPRVQVMRGKQRKGVRYFGPYSHAWAIRDTVDTLLRVFPMRSCSPGVYRRAGQTGRPCLLGDIGKCVAPCVGRVTVDEHREVVDGFVGFMAGNGTQLVKELKRDMLAASDQLDFERAAKFRDDLAALDRVLERQAVVFGDGTDADVLGFAEDDLEVAVQVFFVRGGRIRGQRGWVAEKTDDDADHVQAALMTLYGETTEIPRNVLVPAKPADLAPLTELLAGQRGGPVEIRVPQRGPKRSLMETVEQNARESLARHKLKRSTDLTSRSRALEELQEALDLPEAPLRIECFDISNLQETNTVASMVVFEDALARRNQYRKFNVRNAGQSDVAAMHEVIGRRFARMDVDAAEHDPVDDDRRSSFSYKPGLVVVDGGPPQVAAAQAAMDAAGVSVPVVGLAKRLEEVWRAGDPDPVILPRTSEALYLLQRVRDEAHRFAITHHRSRRSVSMLDSLLDPVPGVGPARRKALLKHFGSLKKMRLASAEQIAAVPGIGRDTAESIVKAIEERE